MNTGMVIEKKFLFTVLILLLTWTSPAVAELAEGIQAFTKLEYPLAIAEAGGLADQGDGDACYLLALLHDPAFHRLPSGKFYQTFFFDADKAVSLYRRAANTGNAYAMHRLAELLLFIEDEPWPALRRADFSLSSMALSFRRKAAPLLREMAEQGDGIAAFMYAEAKRHEPDFFVSMERARYLLEANAWKHDAMSQFYLGKTYLYPRGPVADSGHTMNPGEAFAWFTVAARAGNLHARIYQIEAAELLPIREHGRADEMTRALLNSFSNISDE